MKREDVDLNRAYYFAYSTHKTLALLIPIRVEDSGLGSKGHFWTVGYFYDSDNQRWFYHSGNWTIGNYEETDRRFTREQQRECIKSLFENGIASL